MESWTSPNISPSPFFRNLVRISTGQVYHFATPRVYFCWAELVGPQRSAGRPKAVLGVTVGSVNYADQLPVDPQLVNTVFTGCYSHLKNPGSSGYFFSSFSFLSPPCVQTFSPSFFPIYNSLFLFFTYSRHGFHSHWYLRSAVLCREARADRRPERRALLLFRQG